MKILISSLLVFACFAIASNLFDESAHAAAISQVVTEAQIVRQAEDTSPTKNWVLYTRNAGTGIFRSGPGSVPLGVGSLELNTPTGNDKVFLFNFDHITTRLADISAIGYSTFLSSANPSTPAQIAALNVQIDSNGPDVAGGFSTLVFEPIYNTAQGAVVQGQWQSWDAFSGGSAVWWSSNPIPGAPNKDTFVSWSAIVAANPDATILGGFGVNQGSGNPGVVSSVDRLLIGYDGDVITYNFEPLLEVTSKDQCKAGGWAYVARADDSLFNNQGDCVSYVTTGR